MTDPIRIGLMPPLTGLVNMYGAEIVHAAHIACDEINAQGGLLGRALQLVIEDDGSLPATAVPAALRLVEQHRCVALIGNLLSNSRIAVATEVAEKKRLPYLNFSFYEGSISGRYFFHFAALPNQQISKMIPYMAEHYGLKMFFAGNNYEWPRGSIDAAKRTLQSIGGDIVGEKYLPIGCSAAEIEDLLVQVARSGADVFVPYFAGNDQIALLTHFTDMGLKQRMAVVMGHYDEVMVSRLPAAVREGFYSSNSYFMSIDSPENRRYLEQLSRQPGINGIWPHGNGIQSNFGEGTYLCIKAFAQAVEQAGTTEAEALVAALEQAHLSSPQGEVSMDAKTHHAYVNSYLSRCRADGTFSIIEKFGHMAPFIPERYQHTATALPRQSDMTPGKVAHLAQKMNEAMSAAGTAQQILSIADMSILATDAQGTILECNRSACLLFGYTTDELLGMSVHQLLPPHFRQRHVELLQGFVKADEQERRMETRNEIAGYRKDGTFFPLEASIAKVKNAAGEWMLVVTMRDITSRKKAEEEQLHQATHDTLTGLPNRALIRERLTSALDRSLRTGLSIALLFVDLDGFKLVNDTSGHEAGDLLLKTMASRLLANVRPGDTVARLDGDEFVVLCEQLEQPDAIAAIAEQLNAALRQPVKINHHSLYVTASIGIAIGNGKNHSADTLLHSADTAMYAVKDQGRDGWQFFSSILQEQAQQRLHIIQGLRTAIGNNELSARFQPIIETDSKKIVGAELLLRWHPQGGEISPALFIPVAETTGAIVAIGQWVFRRGCEAEVAWRKRWGKQVPEYISVNVSTRQLNEVNLVQSFADILQQTGADPARMLLEITESALMVDVEKNLQVLRQLADLGLRIAVDDFGTGYSSLAQLTQMPVRVLKIDKAFINGLEDKEECCTVVRAVIGLGKALGLKLVAEGVEKETQLAELRNHGCDFIQGELFYPALDEASFIAAVTDCLSDTNSESK